MVAGDRKGRIYVKLTCTLGFLGFGNMGRAIANGLIENGTIAANDVAAYDVDAGKQQQARDLGAKVYNSPQALAAACDVLVLAMLSIAAGISIAYISERLGNAARVVRVMPNTPAMVNAGAAGIALERIALRDDEGRLRYL